MSIVFASVQETTVQLDRQVISRVGHEVWDPEPPRPDNPLLQLDNVIATPHAAGATLESRIQGNTEAVRQVLMILRGEKPEFLVNPEVWEERRKV